MTPEEVREKSIQWAQEPPTGAELRSASSYEAGYLAGAEAFREMVMDALRMKYERDAESDPKEKRRLYDDWYLVAKLGKEGVMEFRRWWLQEPTLEHADEMQAEARTRMLEVNTYPVLKDDIGVYVFTEEEIRKFGKECIETGRNYPMLTEDSLLDDIFNDKVEEG